MRLDVRKIALFLFLVAPAAQAQLWSGPAAVEVRVEDQKGLPVVGAQLVFQYKALDPKDGPPPVLTDSRGKATVGGLAEGSWHLEVSHDGFMSYLAEITIRPKGRLVLEEAAQFNVVGATRTMQVQISRGKSVSMPRAPAVAERAPAPPPTAPAPRPTVAPTPPRPAAPPAPVPPQEEPAAPAAPAPKERPAPTAPTPTAPTPPPARPITPPAPTPVLPPPAASPAPAPRPTVPPAPVPPPTPAAPAEPVMRPAPAQPTPPPADPVRLRTAKDRTCFECPPGESALSTERVVAPGGGSPCGADLAAQLQSGNVPSGLPAGCHVLRIALPAGTRFTGYRYEMQVGGDSLDCLAGQSCPQSTGRFPINPVLVRRPAGTIVLAPFESGPADRERRAVLTAYFTVGAAKRPR